MTTELRCQITAPPSICIIYSRDDLAAQILLYIQKTIARMRNQLHQQAKICFGCMLPLIIDKERVPKLLRRHILGVHVHCKHLNMIHTELAV